MVDLVEMHARHLRACGNSPRTIKDRTDVLRRLDADLPDGLSYASTNELDAWLGHRADWSQWTRATYAMHIRGFYRWAEGRYLDGDPAIGMARPNRPPGVPNPVSDAQLRQALLRSPEPWLTAITLAAYAGLRASELAELHREDITPDLVRVRRAKGGAAGTVDTHPRIWSAVRDRPAGPLVTWQGRAVTGRWVSAHARRHFDSIGLPDVHMHRFRHWYATTLLERGADVRTVQEALRHRSITSTQGYTLVAGGRRRDAIRALP